MPHNQLLRKAQVFIELGVIAIAALWIGRQYLTIDPDIVPYGSEFHLVIQTHHFWTWIKTCGVCALWNGTMRGGFPALVDLQGAILHPIVIAATLLWGVVNGAKFTLVASFGLAGAAQWQLARTLKLGWVARLWSGLLAVVGAHLAGRMEGGWLGIILSTATASLVFAPTIALAGNGKRREMIWLAVVLALTALSGQGYAQIGVLFASPALLFLLMNGKLQLRPVWRRFMIVGIIALLLVSPVLAPLFHFLPNFDKGVSPQFTETQPLEYLVLNFVIRDFDFHFTSDLSKPASAVHSALYIGWVPVILALLTPAFAKKGDRRELLFLAASAGLILLAASGFTLRLLVGLFPALAVVRNAMMIAPISVTPILALSAYSLDKLLKSEWRVELFSRPAWAGRVLPVALKLLLVIPLIGSVYSAAQFSRYFLWTLRVNPEVYDVLEALKTPSLQWVQTPAYEWVFVETGIRMGLRFSPGAIPWYWKDRDTPAPYLEARRTEKPAPENGVPSDVAKFATIYNFSDFREFAYVGNSNGMMTPCAAFGVGGDLTVECDASEDGWLILRENSWDNWYAWRDGMRIPLEEHDWLTVEAPAGKHHYRFRYLPWDVPAGLLLALVGCILMFWVWRKFSE